MLWDVFGVTGAAGPRDRLARWGRCCSRACSSSTTCRKACSTSRSVPPTRPGCCCSTSRTCARCSRTSPSMPTSSSATYGNVAPASVGAIQRQLLTLESQGGDKLFGEPALELADLMRTDRTAAGYINLLAADKLMQSPQRLRDAAAVAALRAVRAAARGRRPRQAQARLLLRRGAPALRRRACCAARRRSSRSCG